VFGSTRGRREGLHDSNIIFRLAYKCMFVCEPSIVLTCATVANDVIFANLMQVYSFQSKEVIHSRRDRISQRFV